MIRAVRSGDKPSTRSLPAGDTTVSYAWSPVYVDAMIARDRNTTGDDSVLEERLYAQQDANFNVTVNERGELTRLRAPRVDPVR
jgi:hypothetical protein